MAEDMRGVRNTEGGTGDCELWSYGRALEELCGCSSFWLGIVLCPWPVLLTVIGRGSLSIVS